MITAVSNKPCMVGPFALFDPNNPATRLEDEAANITAHLTSRSAAGALVLHFNSTGAGDVPEDGDADFIAVTISELGALPGEYVAVFVPPAPGAYTLVLRHAASQADLAEEIRVDTVTLTDIGGYSLLPLERDVADVGGAIDLVVRFVLPDGASFDPYELRQVDIRNAATDVLLFQVGAASIVRLSQGTYRVRTPVAIGEGVTLADRWFYRAFSGNPEASRAFSRVVAQAAADDGLLISVERLKRHELLGINLTDDAGNPFPDDTFREAIREATDALESELDLTLWPTTIAEEVHDYREEMYHRTFGHFQLRRRPLIAVDHVHASYPSLQDGPLVLPPEWVVITNPKWGNFNLVPQTGTLAQFLTAQSGHGNQALFGPLFLTGASWWPGIFKIAYQAGFAIGHVPPRIQHAVALQASLQILDIAGDLIAGAGIASTSHSIGGLSSSISTTASATNHGYGAKRGNYIENLKVLKARIRAEYHGTHLLGAC